jgi:hypothetical protein
MRPAFAESFAGPGLATAGRSPWRTAHPGLFRQIIEAAKEYAADRTLVFTALAQGQELASAFHYILHTETQTRS